MIMKFLYDNVSLIF